MSDTNLTEAVYVSKDLEVDRKIKNFEVTLNAKIDKIDTKIDNVEVRLNARIDKLEAKIDKIDSKLNAKIDVLNARMDVLDMKIDKVNDTLGMAIGGLIDRFEDMKEHQNKWFTVFGLLFTAASIIAPVAVAIVQYYLK